MRKIELIEMVLDNLSGGDAVADVRGRYHPQMISKFLEAAYNDLIYQVVEAAIDRKNNKVDFTVVDAFAKIHRNIAVSDDADRSLKYSILPFAPLKLPEDRGIRMICPEDDPTNPFAPVDNNSQAVFAALDVGVVDDVPTYFLEKMVGNEYRVYYPDDVVTTKVTMLLILPLSEYDDYDDIPMPAGKDLSIVDTVVERLREKPQEDVVNDNIASQ